MTFASIMDGVDKVAKVTALEILSQKVPVESLSSLNEPIDFCGLYAKDAAKDGIDPQTKKEIKNRSGWPDSIVDNVRSEDEANVYLSANLEVKNIDGKDCLVKRDIDISLVYEGQTNLERMLEGKSPVTSNGEKIELHHIGQNPDAPLAELTTEEHRGYKSDMILHDKTVESKIDRYAFRAERESYWMSRAEQLIKEKENE